MDEKKNKSKGLKIILIILLIIGLGVACFFALQKYGILNTEEKNNDTSKVDNTEEVASGKYKMIKFADCNEKIKNNLSSNIIETEKYYIFYFSMDSKGKTILFDKNGADVTKKVFGVDNIWYISAIKENNSTLPELYIVKTDDGKDGLYDKNFKQIIKIDNHGIERISSNDYFLVGKEIKDSTIIDTLENVGIYDKNGKVVVPREYERIRGSEMYVGNKIYNTDKTLFYARKNGKYGIIDQNNNVIIPFEYDEVMSKIKLQAQIFKVDNKNYYILIKNGKYGMVDENNKAIIDFDKESLQYNEYANVVIETTYENSEAKKLNIYNLKGELKKEIDLNDNFKAEFYAYYNDIKGGLLLYDNDYVYVLNKDLEYEKHVRPASFEYHWSTHKYLSSKTIYLKENNGKFKVYKTSDDSLYLDGELYLFNDMMLSNTDDYVLCKNKTGDSEYTNCGIIDKDGKTVLDFKYHTNNHDDLSYNNEYITYEYNIKTEKHELKKQEIKGTCTADNKKYYIRDNIINVDSSLYDLNCNKIADDFINFYVLSKNLLITENQDKNKQKSYKIYDINKGKLADIVNEDNATITSYMGVDITDQTTTFVITNKGIYKIVSD